MPKPALLVAMPLAMLLAPTSARADAAQAEPMDFDRNVLPIFKKACVECHGPHKASGGLQLVSGEKILEGGFTGDSVVPGSAATSYLVARLLGHGDEDRMPIKGDPLSEAEIAVVTHWIDQGAHFQAAAAPAFSPKPAGVARLTVDQYQDSLRTLFGDDLVLPEDLEPDMVISGSAVVGAARFAMSQRATEQFGVAAFEVARQVVARPAWRAEWLPCVAGASEVAARPARLDENGRGCLRALIARLGRLVWRRPLEEAERARYARLGDETLRRTGTYERAAVAIVAGLLQSPNFLYRVETGIADPSDPNKRKLTDFELASRLSFFLWGTTPDETLLDAAAQGRLADEAGLREQADRLMAAPRARTSVDGFFAELFDLKRIDRAVRQRPSLKGAPKTLARSMKDETLRVIGNIVFDDTRDFREIFDTKETYVNDDMARHYGLPAETVPAGAQAWVRVDAPANRIGVLGHASFLAVNSSRIDSSPTRRGKFIREKLLCQAVPPPPPDVSSKLPEAKADAPKTLRDRLDAHRSAQQCKGCHKAMDPMGFAFESFDAVGAFREKEDGLPIDTSGDFDGVRFKNAGELAKLLRQSDRVGVCMARNLYRFALGTLETDADEPLIEEFTQALSNSHYRFRSLLTAVVNSRAFRYVSTPK